PIPHLASRLIGQFFREPDDPIERLLDVVQGRRVRQPHVAIVSERSARHQRHAGGGHEPGAELRPRDPSERVHPEEEVERAERLHELDPGELLSEARNHDVPSLAEFGHHPGHVPFHLVVAERHGGGQLSGVIRPRGPGTTRSRSRTLSVTLHWGSPGTSTGRARDKYTISGYDTHAGAGIATTSPGPNSVKHTLNSDCFEPFDTTMLSAFTGRPPE